ncbi:fumarylacetoacetate hydrolase family protein [Halarchaeum acidiphilum MH1-52-1]|uniref:Fumarylacetoacetate hydrolase family protein n=1 Tax=Halarchaeum acidiphilum MH1-52-1 TaxID=1261545 RepID=U2YXS0_9EURY|nr:fumarylacetoacetate hydrolase family protein [Halarchaeum acidiphilum]GAD53840.1 fumarylacetoacetate hydrolase family protein [Halarchaeum acidiphilum MH1-52-1]
MKFVTFDDGRLGVLSEGGDGVVDLTGRLGLSAEEPLVEYMAGDYDASEYADADADYALDEVSIEAPVGRPGKVIAAPLNYENHIEEAIADRDITTDEWFSIEDKGYFLKAPSSVIGVEENIVIPFNDRRIDHEVELAFVMGEETKNADNEEAWENIFGYTILLDISVRGDQDRSNRKSYDTFTVVGPYVVTPDEVGDPQDLDLELAVNGEVRQSDTTSDMVYTCADVVQYASIGATLDVGDVITTGTPEASARCATATPSTPRSRTSVH